MIYVTDGDDLSLADRAATAVPAPAPAVPVAIRRVPDRGPVAGRDRDRTAPVPAPDRELRHRAVPSHGRHLSRAERDRQVSSIDAGSPGKCDHSGSSDDFDSFSFFF